MAKSGAPGALGRARLPDVARTAGVSIVTVSRAINAPDTVSAKTRARIEEAMKALDYVPDLAARSMAKRRSGIVAALVPNLLDPIFVGMVRGLETVLARHGLHLLIGNTGYDLESEEAFVVAALGRRPEGLVLTGLTHTDRAHRLIGASGVPIVETWDLQGMPVDRAVGYDQRAAGRTLTRHLIERGYRRIGYVGRPVIDNGRAAAKLNGYLDALRAADCAISSDLILECETDPSDASTVVDHLVGGANADAIVFSGDRIATGAFMACLERGLRVPQDVALCGFGDHELSSLLPGGLTTIAADAVKIGEIAANSILSSSKPGNEHALEDGPVTDISFELVVRGST